MTGLPMASRPFRPVFGREYNGPLTGMGCMNRIHTDLAVFLIQDRGVVVLELFGTHPGRLQDPLDAPLVDGTGPPATRT